MQLEAAADVCGVGSHEAAPGEPRVTARGAGSTREAVAGDLETVHGDLAPRRATRRIGQFGGTSDRAGRKVGGGAEAAHEIAEHAAVRRFSGQRVTAIACCAAARHLIDGGRIGRREAGSGQGVAGAANEQFGTVTFEPGAELGVLYGAPSRVLARIDGNGTGS